MIVTIIIFLIFFFSNLFLNAHAKSKITQVLIAFLITCTFKIFLLTIITIAASIGKGCVQNLQTYDCLPIYNDYYVISKDNLQTGYCTIINNEKPIQIYTELKIVQGINTTKYVNNEYHLSNLILRELAWPIQNVNFGNDYIVTSPEAVSKE